MHKLQIKKLRTTAVAVIVTVGFALAGVFASVAPASAAAGNVNITFGNWHCPQGGSVIYINGATVNPAGYGTYNVRGNKASIFVWLNTRDTVYATVTCHYQPHWYMPWYWINVPVSIYGESFWPSYAGQNFGL